MLIDNSLIFLFCLLIDRSKKINEMFVLYYFSQYFNLIQFNIVVNIYIIYIYLYLLTKYIIYIFVNIERECENNKIIIIFLIIKMGK